MRHLFHWLHLFPREQFFIVNFEYLIRNTSDTMQRIEKFLGLDPQFTAKVKLPHDNTAVVKTSLDCTTRDLLQIRYAPRVQRLYDYVAMNTTSYEPPFLKFSDTPLQCFNKKMAL